MQKGRKFVAKFAQSERWWNMNVEILMCKQFLFESEVND